MKVNPGDISPAPIELTPGVRLLSGRRKKASPPRGQTGDVSVLRPNEVTQYALAELIVMEQSLMDLEIAVQNKRKLIEQSMKAGAEIEEGPIRAWIIKGKLVVI